MARLALAIACLVALAALADARSCRNPNTCRNNGECITPKSGKGFECLCSAGFDGERCENVITPQAWKFYAGTGCTYLTVTHPPLDYNDATAACRRAGGELAFIGDDGLNDWLGNDILSEKENTIAKWIGLKKNRNDVFQWKSDDIWDDVESYAAWEAGYPGLNEVDKCVFMDTRKDDDGENVVVWLVDDCKDKRRYICQRCPDEDSDSQEARRRRRRRRRNSN